jgi:hypothetical protein
MTERRTLQFVVEIPAEPQAVFDAMTDWERQHEWMLATKVRADAAGARSAGGRIAAFTGVGPLGFWGTMTVTRWEEPRLVEVDHTGKVVRGLGIFRVEQWGPGTRFVWREEVDPPLGRAGALGWYIVKPLIAAGVAVSLRRFARFAARR